MAAKFAFLEQFQPQPLSSCEPIVPIDGTHVLWKEKKMLHFCAQDALGLSQHNDLKKNAIKYLLQFGAGNSIFRHLKESLPCHQRLQEKLALLLGVEQTLLLPTRSSALSILLSRLSQPSSILFVDEGSHPLLLEAVESQKTQVVHYPHQSASHLKDLLQSTQHLSAFSRIILTESVFATSGSSAALQEIIPLADQHNAILVVDDSFGFGLKGDEGLGLAAQREGIDCIVASLIESCGIPAAFLGCDRELAEFLLTTYPFWKEHPIATPTLGAIDAALETIPQMEGERRQLEHRCHWLLLQLSKLGFPVQQSHSHIITLDYEGGEETSLLSQSLIEQGILCDLISDHQSPEKLRFTINVLHTPEDLNHLYQALQIGIKDAAGSIVAQHP